MKNLLVQEWRRSFGFEKSDLEEKHVEIAIRGRRVFSQRDEDGAIEAVFDRIGTTDKVKLHMKDQLSDSRAHISGLC